MTPNAPPLAELDAPQPLKGLKQWLVWRYEPAYDKDGNRIPKDLKKPYYANGSPRYGAQGTDLDRRKLVSFDQAKAAAIAGNYEGVGIAFLKGTPLTGLDYDNCVTDGVIDAGVMATTQGTYTEYSPSGNGIRAFVLGELGSRKDCKAAEEGIGFEMFNTSGFLTYTGNITLETEVDGAGITAPNTALHALIKERFGRVDREACNYGPAPEGLSDAQIETMLGKVNPDTGYHDWLHIGMGIHHETQGEGFHLWDMWSGAGIKYRGAEDLFGRWKGFGLNGGQPRTINTLRQLMGEAGAVDVSADDFEDLGKEPHKPRFQLVEWEDLKAKPRKVSWIVKNFLPHSELGVMFGASTTGKSFLAMDLACAIGAGTEWNGHRVTQGRVLYVVAEGRNGFLSRMDAYDIHHGVQKRGVALIENIVPNLTDSKQVDDLVLDIRAQAQPFCLIIMDTFAQMTAGINENSGEDMGSALEQCKRISRASGAMVLLIHHSGKDASKGARGWSGLRAAADVELEVERCEDLRSVKVTKLKDGRDGAEHGFKLVDVVLGTDEDGDKITSCVIEYTDTGRPRVMDLGKNEAILMAVMESLVGFGGEERIPEDTLLTLAVTQVPGADRSTKGNLRKALGRLAAKNCVLRAEGYVWASESAKGAGN